MKVVSDQGYFGKVTKRLMFDSGTWPHCRITLHLVPLKRDAHVDQFGQ